MTAPTSSRMRRSAVVRVAGLLAFWTAIAGLKPEDLPIGALAAVVATWASLDLLPPGQRSFHPVAMGQLAVHFLRQSVVAGVDVAWRALHPKLPLRPGFVAYRPHIPSGLARSAFCTMASLLPGTLPCGADEKGAVVVHCLDESQPVTGQLEADEALFERAFGGAYRDD